MNPEPDDIVEIIETDKFEILPPQEPCGYICPRHDYALRLPDEMQRTKTGWKLIRRWKRGDWNKDFYPVGKPQTKTPPRN